MRKIVITGATGFLAVPLIKLLAEENAKIYAVVRPNSLNLERLDGIAGIELIELALSELNKLPNFIEGPIDVFYHFGWSGMRGKDRLSVETQRANYISSMLAVNAAVDLRANAFIGVGSQAEYGKISGVMREDMQVYPDTEYGKCKTKVCIGAEKILDRAKIRFVWGRVFSAYGRYDFPGSLIETAIMLFKKGEPLHLSAGSQKWNYTYVDDIAVAFYKFGICKSVKGIINVASGDGRRLFEYMTELRGILNSKSRIECDILGEQDNIHNIEPSVSKLRDFLGWLPQTTFREGIRKRLEL